MHGPIRLLHSAARCGVAVAERRVTSSPASAGSRAGARPPRGRQQLTPRSPSATPQTGAPRWSGGTWHAKACLVGRFWGKQDAWAGTLATESCWYCFLELITQSTGLCAQVRRQCLRKQHVVLVKPPRTTEADCGRAREVTERAPAGAEAQCQEGQRSRHVQHALAGCAVIAAWPLPRQAIPSEVGCSTTAILFARSARAA